MKGVWRQLSETGISKSLSSSENSRIRISNQVIVIISLASFLYFGYELIFLPTRPTSTQVFFFYLFHGGMVLVFIPVLVLNKYGQYNSARLFMIVPASALIFFNSRALAQPFRSELYFFVLAVFVFVIFSDLRIIIPLFLLQAVGYFMIVRIILDQHPEITEHSMGVAIRILISYTILFFMLFFLQREAEKYKVELEIKNNQLSRDHEKVVKLNFTKDKIFSIISHDLRSPLASLHAILGMLRKEQISADEFKTISSGLEKQVLQLRNSLDELLIWSQAQLQGINVAPEMLLLKPLITEVVSVNRIAGRDKNITITTTVPGDAKVFCDPNMLKSVVTNLLTNAIKFTPVGGAISIFCSTGRDHAMIYVEDTGIGIPAENMEKILNSSTHFTTVGTSNEKGTGLGLAMCREFISKNNGTLEIRSVVGKGSSFVITLPSHAATRIG